MNNFNLRQLFAICMLALATVCLAQPPTTAPATQPSPKSNPQASSNPATKPTSRPTAKGSTLPTTHAFELDPNVKKDKHLRELTRKSIELMTKKQYDKAEAILAEAIKLDPEDPTNLYNMACILALTKRPDPAVEFLEKSADAGFLDFVHIAHDEDLNSLHELPRYKALIAKKEMYLRKSAEIIIEALKKRFGRDYLYEIDEKNKLIFATNTDRQTLDSLKANLVRQATSQWDQLFANQPEQYIAVVVPSPREFHKLIPIPGIEGIYQHNSRTLIAKGLGFVTTHEFTHALHAADLDPLGQEHPIWLVEGMAVMFEKCEYEKDSSGKEVLIPKDNDRLPLLQGHVRQKQTIPLARLLAMDHQEFMGNRVLECYAQSGSIVHYLYEKQLLRKFYDTFKETFDKDKTGKQAMEKTVGKPIEEIEKEWKEWVVKRLPPAHRIAMDGPFLGVDFGEANDGMLIQKLFGRGPASKAGMHVGDVIISMDGVEARDETTFTPILAGHKPGDVVVFRIRRSRNYLEIPVKLGSRNNPNGTGGAATMPSPPKVLEAPK